MRLFLLNFLLLPMIFLLSPHNTFAASPWYVDNQATGANNGTSWQNAWKSFGNIAWSSIKPGDTVYVSGGGSSKTYLERLVVGTSGSIGSPITITKGKDSGHNGKAIIDSQFARQSGIAVISRNYVTVSGFTVKGASSRHGEIELDGTTGVIIENCDITMEKAHGGIYAQENQNYILRNNRISTPGTTQLFCSGQTDGIYSQRDKYPRFEGNYIIIRSTNQACHCDCIQMYMDESPILINNYCEHDDGKTTSNSQGFYATTGTGTMTAIGNIAYSPTSLGYQLTYKLSPGANLIAYHNTLIADNTAYTHTLYTDSSISKTTLNNLVLDISEVNNHFTNIANRDFHLKTGSPAIAAGQNVSLEAQYRQDRDGNTRGADNKWDLGSYEFGGSNPIQSPSTLPGDFTDDGHVDLYDYNKLVTNYGHPYTLFDYNLLVANFNR